MKYISEIFALNLFDANSWDSDYFMPGDWHQSAIKWDNLRFLETEDSIFKDFGIYKNKSVPFHDGTYYVANILRACLDMLELGQFTILQGMNNNYICNEKITPILFYKVLMLRNNENWDNIKKFMHKEYGKKWRLFLEKEEKNL